MSHASHRLAISRRRTGGVGSAWWFARWLLVLVLMLDHVSAPFHHHQHDGGGGQFEAVAAHEALDEGDVHAEEHDHLPSHSAMAIRVDPARLGQLPAVDLAGAWVTVNATVQLLAILAEPQPEHWLADRSRPDFRSHRSLPPAGRAPPLHA
ncbi:hypothetical protein [Aquabacterium sp. CECT 9606]|uniref:hypothetical protein n=1 Tax=Aquabacterium sp. CECT 9606 TaxID=2845822 RepID=UPI001E49DD76|nr:hypothetical protein [Aquabacterium sp. CECT 9606]